MGRGWGVGGGPGRDRHWGYTSSSSWKWSWHVHALHSSNFLGKMRTCSTGAIEKQQGDNILRLQSRFCPSPQLLKCSRLQSASTHAEQSLAPRRTLPQSSPKAACGKEASVPAPCGVYGSVDPLAAALCCDTSFALMFLFLNGRKSVLTKCWPRIYLTLISLYDPVC